MHSKIFIVFVLCVVEHHSTMVGILLFFISFFEGQFSGLRWFLATESTLKNDENALSFMLKAILVLEISTFLSWLFVYVETSLIRRLKLISIFMMSQARQKTITIKILPNISRSKDKKGIKFGQLTEYNLKKDFSSKIMMKMRQED